MRAFLIFCASLISFFALEDCVSSLSLDEAEKIIEGSSAELDTEEKVFDDTHIEDLHENKHELPKAIRLVLDSMLTDARTCRRSEPYRRMNGLCNNLDNPLWGASLHMQERLVENDYNDKKSVPRLKGVDGSYLPSARLVSLKCFPESRDQKKYLDKTISQMHMQFGQYIDHDLIFTELEEGTGCCDPTLINIHGLHRDVFHDGACFPIPIFPRNDRYFNSTCMGFRRSFGLFDDKGELQQISAATSFIDASTVYGRSMSHCDQLRTFHGGKLIVSSHNFLPLKEAYKCVKQKISHCYFAGDSRVNVFPGLTILHTVFHRFHNNLVEGLQKVNPHWDDEKLFQEARKINMAVHQAITYNEYLPKILGYDVMKRFGFFDDFQYDKNLNPGIINSFGTAAFRFGHSQINDFMKIHGESYVALKDIYFRPEKVTHERESDLKSVIKSQCARQAALVDEKFSLQVTDLLFFGVDAPHESTDLGARNVQRARDHGNAGWLTYVKYCERKYPSLFDRSLKLPDCFQQHVYKSVEDIDLFVGGLSEQPIEGGIVGRTFACLLIEQFKRLRNGDRFFYETKDPGIGFTNGQLENIKAYTLSSVLCHNTGLKALQLDAFAPAIRIPGTRTNYEENYVPCDNHSNIDFELWRD